MEYLHQLGFCQPWKMNWLTNSPDLNPIENFWGVLKWRVYKNWYQFRSKEDLWQTIVNVAHGIASVVIQKLICSMDQCIIQVLSMKGSHIPYKPAPQFFKTLFSVDLYLFHVTVYIHNNLYIKQFKHFLIYMSFNYTSLIIWNSYNLSKWGRWF